MGKFGLIKWVGVVCLITCLGIAFLLHEVQPLAANVSMQQATPIPPTIDIHADSSVIKRGQCTLLLWKVDNIQAIFMDGVNTVGQGSRQVCPRVTTIYNFDIVLSDGSLLAYPYTITVDQQNVQEQIDFTLNPNAGTQTLMSGFDAPFVQALTAGGTVDVSYLAGCAGFATSAPDFRVSYTQQGFAERLKFSFVSEAETMLIVNSPNGAWYCDDSDIAFTDPQSGFYDVWIANSIVRSLITGTLEISE